MYGKRSGLPVLLELGSPPVAYMGIRTRMAGTADIAVIANPILRNLKCARDGSVSAPLSPDHMEVRMSARVGKTPVRTQCPNLRLAANAGLNSENIGEHPAHDKRKLPCGRLVTCVSSQVNH